MKGSARAAVDSTKRVLWAVDAWSSSPRQSLTTLRAIRGLFAGGTVVVEPVYVVSPAQFDFRAPEITTDRSISWTAETKLKELLQPVEGAEILAPTLLTPSGISRRSEVKELLKYAGETGAQLIAVTTHGKGAVRRLFLGSFTEDLIVQSKLPVLVIKSS